MGWLSGKFLKFYNKSIVIIISLVLKSLESVYLLWSFVCTCRYSTKARDVLHHYSHMPSFHGIHQDCDEIVKQLIVQLREQLRNPKVINFSVF